MNLTEKVKEINNTYQQLVGIREAKLSNVQSLESEIQNLRASTTNGEESLKFLQVLYDHRKREVFGRFESLVTEGLQTVFEQDLKLKIKTEVKRGYISAKPVIIENFNGRELELEPTESSGGGIQIIIAFLFRLLFVLLYNPPVAKILFLDETFANVSRSYLPNVSLLLASLVERLNVQIIMNTHQDELEEYADVVYTLTKDSNGYARIVSREEKEVKVS